MRAARGRMLVERSYLLMFVFFTLRLVSMPYIPELMLASKHPQENNPLEICNAKSCVEVVEKAI